MHKALFFSAFLIPFMLFAQDTSPFPGSFVMQGYLLQQDTLTLTARDRANPTGFMSVYTFGESRSLSYDLEIPEGMGICGNGLLYIEEASYKFRKKAGTLIMDITGGHLVEDSFRYKAKYKVEHIAGASYRLVLLKVKRKDIKADGQMSFQTSAASIQEHTPTGLAPGAY